MSRSMAVARAAGSFSGTRVPVRPSSISSGMPATWVETTGTSMAMASTSTLGIPSVSGRKGTARPTSRHEHGIGEDLPPAEVVGHAGQDEEVGLAIVAG